MLKIKLRGTSDGIAWGKQLLAIADALRRGGANIPDGIVEWETCKTKKVKLLGTPESLEWVDQVVVTMAELRLGGVRNIPHKNPPDLMVEQRKYEAIGIKNLRWSVWLDRRAGSYEKGDFSISWLNAQRMIKALCKSS